MTETDTVAALVERMREAARGVQKLLGDRAPLTMNAASVLSLIAAYEAERERSDCAEQSESELVQGAKDLDLQIEDLRADRDALAELLRRAGEVLNAIGRMQDGRFFLSWDDGSWLIPPTPNVFSDIVGSWNKAKESLLADIEAKLPKPTSPPA